MTIKEYEKLKKALWNIWNSEEEEDADFHRGCDILLSLLLEKKEELKKREFPNESE